MMFLLICCYAADLILGDPEWFPHPVRGMGKIISVLDNNLRKRDVVWIGRIKGVLLTFIVVGISAYAAYLLLELSRTLSPLLGKLAWIYLGYTTLSIKDLQVKAKAILKEIEKGSVSNARKELSKIAGRDTENLNKEKMVTGTIESIAESTNDGIIAPLFYLILGGPLLAISYKAINTLDSMVGHRNDRYLHFGWFSAKLDDVFNFIPARLCGFLMSISSFILGKGFLRAFKTMLRDGRRHPSPNSGLSEAAIAGALGIRLGGPVSYQGKFSKRPYIGEEKRPIKASLINEALNISFVASIIMVSIGALLRWIV